ncbi:MAG: 6-bladed beta-propeller [Candidatus Krumholzibacteriia bacterium]|nr:6-bladed beta-propeller [Candidatus Latescibacterota bacterium]MCB9516349.1 6-bladed beta-propeller [Candidatus Latescibacterota bacterium]
MSSRPSTPTTTRRALHWLSAGLICLLLAGPAAADWQGSMGQENGVTVVHNPATPAQGAKTLELKPTWTLGGDTDDEDEFFGLIARIVADDDGNLYVLDAQLNEVKLYSADGEFIRSIGREGEGPGEFRGANGLFLLKDGTVAVAQLAPAKIVLLSPDGTPAGERPVPLPEGAGFAIIMGAMSSGDTETIVLAWNEFQEGKFTQHSSLVQVDAEGKILHTFATGDRTMEFSNAIIDEKIWDAWQNRWGMFPDGRVVANESWGDYRLTVWTPDGKVDHVITRDYKHRQRTAEEVARVSKIFEAFTRQVPNAKMEISDVDQDVFRVYPLDNGNLLINPSRGAMGLDDGVIGVFDLYDGQGRYQREITLKGKGNPRTDGYFFIGNRLYVVTDLLSAAMAAQGGGADDEALDDAEPMSIICYELPADVLGG